MTLHRRADDALVPALDIRPDALVELGRQGAIERNGARQTDWRGKTILLLEQDLYRSVGGGQTSYRKLIEGSPHNTYYYLAREEGAAAARPANARIIPFRRRYVPNTRDLPGDMSHFYWDYFECWQIAGSVAAALGPCRFDVVDAPDYQRFALFIRAALAAHDIGVGQVALAMHGTISSALSDRWPRRSAAPRTLAQLRLREHLQFRVADARYALSQAYAEEWERVAPLPVHLIDPLGMLDAFAPTADVPPGPVDLCFIGRRERRKGPDLAVDLAWALPKGSFRRLRLIGAEPSQEAGYGSEAIIAAMARLRGLRVESTPNLSRAEMDSLFRTRTIVVLPSRYDQFNLVALEALRHGCPVFVSNRTGAARWIFDHYPELSDLVIDIDCARTGALAIAHALNDYDGLRRRIVDVLTSRPPQAFRGNLDGMWQPSGEVDLQARTRVADIRVRFDSFNRPRLINQAGPRAKLKRFLGRTLSQGSKRQVRRAIGWLRWLKRLPQRARHRSLKLAVTRTLGKQAVQRKWLHESAPGHIRNMRAIDGTRRRLLGQPERTTLDIGAKLVQVSAELPGMRVGRVPIFRDMVRLERKRGGDLTAATYCLRIMRWLDRDRFGDLDFVVATLQDHGFIAEAEAADAMFRDPASAEQRCRAILDAQYERHRSKPDLPYEILDDRRGDATPAVSVISSLYNAESKLRTLLDNMRIQSIAQAGRLEVVLVDSGSPTREYEAFKAFAATSDLPVVFARSKGRESIQKAWNRGIKLARAPYLSFLGVDEGLHPDCLSILAGTLDRRPDIDWVMADSIVTDVDRKGIYAGDVMPYDREDYDWSKVFLDTTYLSWVGGLYRRSIHDRYGYYDESFRAAGDTEFKGRVLSRIKTLHIPQVLGIFNNYPEERTTQSPRAELEDLRAWYLHRTPAGIAYSYDRHPIEVAEGLLRTALTYRKCYCRHWSTDFDMAHAVATYLTRRGENPAFATRALQATAELVRVARQFDTLDFQQRPSRRQLWALRSLYALRQREDSDRSALGLSMRPHYAVFNDNRHEQHWWSWSV